jgi:hypothetical protein
LTWNGGGLVSIVPASRSPGFELDAVQDRRAAAISGDRFRLMHRRATAAII